MNTQQVLFTEIFPIDAEALPHLYRYKIDLREGDLATVGGKLAYRFQSVFAGHWAWADRRLVTDTPQDEAKITPIIQQLWSEQPDVFRGLRGIALEPDTRISAQGIAEFVVRGLLREKHPQLRKELDRRRQDLGKAYVDRLYDLRAWVVDGQPAISLSISSRIVHKQDCREYALEKGEEELIGLLVADKSSTFKGEVQKIAGQLGSERTRLLALAQREEIRELIANAPDDETVVSVANGHIHPYDYVAGALNIIPRMEDLRRFGINPSQALKAMRLDPDYRSKIVREVVEIISDQYLGRAYNSAANPQLFITTPYSTNISVGGDRVVTYNEKALLPHLMQHGLYKVADEFHNGNSIRIGILDTLRGSKDQFMGEVERQLRPLGFDLKIVGREQVQPRSRVEIDQAIGRLQSKEPHLLLAFLPDQNESDEEGETSYYHLKSLTVGQGLPSQAVEQSTLKNDYAIGNIIMGILGKTGNIPYVLADPLNFADVIVGIDIAREKKKRLAGSVNATAVARIYLNNGEFLGYVIHDMPLEGETIPNSVLQALFPVHEFSGKRVVIHRDGYFRGTEKRTLQSWAKQIDATFHLIEVIKSGTPRMYGSSQHGAMQPKKGSAFLMSDTEALLVSTLPPFKNATPQPLRIRTESSLSIEQALQSILAMTSLHYGSLRPPKLPVTIHYSDKIAQMALRGIKPKNLEGNIPFWL